MGGGRAARHHTCGGRRIFCARESRSRRLHPVDDLTVQAACVLLGSARQRSRGGSVEAVLDGTHYLPDDFNLDDRFSKWPAWASAFRLSTTPVSRSLAGSRFSSDSAPGPLYGAF